MASAKCYVFTPPTSSTSALGTIYANADGGIVSIPWSSDVLPASHGGWESTVSSTASAGYSFTQFDNVISKQISFGASSVVVVLEPISFYNSKTGTGNQTTPNYVFTSGYAATAGFTQLYTAAGSDYPGNGSIAQGHSAQGVDNTAFPATWMPAFYQAWKSAFTAAINHMATATYASQIAYVRVGGGAGGEWNPFATAIGTAGLLTIPGGPTNLTQLSTTWINQYMSSTQAALVSLSSPFKFVQATDAGFANSHIPYSWADSEASLAASNSLGIGCEGLKGADITAFTNHQTNSGGSNYTGYTSMDHAYTFANNSVPIYQFQTSAASDPTNTNSPGSLIPLIPYALQRGATSLELYYQDWQVAYDTSNQYNAQYGPSYAAAIQGARTGTELQLTVSSGNNQSGTVSTTLPAALVVEALAGGSAQSGIVVTFSDGGAGGTFSANPVTTNGSGLASTTYKLPATPGAIVINATSTPFNPATFNETANSNVLSLSVASGNNQTGFVNATLANPLVVNASVNGTLTAGIPVTFSTGSGGSFGTNPATTGSNGAATSTYTLPNSPGSIAITATASGYTTAQFAETAQSTTNVLSIVSGSNQSGSVSAILTAPLVVKAKVNGTATSGVSVVWTTPAGSVAPGTSTTNALGVASTTATLPSTPQVYSITAAATSFSPVTFTETALSSTAASSLGLVSGYFTDPSGVAINGTVEFKLSGEGRNGVSACFVPVPVNFSVNGGTVTALVAFNDKILPFGTTYQISVKDLKGGQLFNGTYTLVGTFADLTKIPPG